MQAANEWAARQEELLLQERDEERAQLQQRLSACSAAQCEAAGLSLLRLQVQTSHTSLYGRVTISLAKRNNASLPAHQLKVGDEVEVFDTMQSQSSKKREGKNESSGSIPNSVCGVVCAVNATAIDFVCDDNQSDEVTSSWLSSSNSLRLNLRSSEANHKKLMDVLRTMRAVAGGSNNDCLESTPVIMDALFCERRQNDVLTEHSSKCNERSIKPFNQNLNDSQRSAISFALNDPFRISLIHGPPGTGKTTAVTELILQAIVRGKRILVCAPSNVAVDNILERLVSEHYYYRPSDYHDNAESGPSNAVKKVKVQAVRLGHPARMSSIVQNHCLDALVLCHEGTEIVKDVRKDIDAARKKLSKVSGKGDKTKRKELRSELKALRREARQREDKVVKDIVASRNVVLSTCVGAASRLIKSTPFDFVVIDEAAQALEVACWIPIMRCCEKLVLAGDHCQLPPTIKSADAAKNGLGVTLFERIIQHPVLKSCAKLLDTQYRMNNTICEWASEVMYDGRLVSHASNASITLRDLMPPPLNTAQPSDTDDLADSVMMLIDTAGCSMEEDGCSRDDSALTTLSYRNTHEAGIVKKHVQDLYALGLSPDQIGIITPYNGQLEYLRGILLDESRDDDGNEKLKGAKDRESSKRLEIRTVDGFQGGEKEAIILSLVRSNSLRQVGFLSEKRRINVAVTRAKRHVMVVCDSETVSNDPFIGGLLNYISAKGDVRSAMEFVEDEVSCSSEQTVLASTMKDLHSATVKQLMDPHLHAAPASSLCTEGKTVAKRKTKRQGAPQMSVPVPPRVKESPACKYDGMASFRNVMKELLRLLADPGGREVCGEGLRGGSIGGAAVRHFNADMAMKLSKVDDAKEKIRIFSELITPHGGAARERLRGLIGESLASVDMDMDDLLVFPASLSAQERQAVHSAADELNSHSVGRKLHHKTFDVPAVGSGRQLLVSVSPLHPPPATSPPDSSEDKEVLTVDLKNESSDEERSLETEGAPSEIHSSKVSKTKKKKSGNKNKKAVKLGGDGSNSDTFSRIGGKKTFSKSDESVITNSADLDEIALLEMTIAENEKLKDYNKYRVRFQGAMPNNEKEVRSDALRSKIQKAKDARCPDKKASSGSTKKKLLKKPPRNFGGGRVGDQES